MFIEELRQIYSTFLAATNQFLSKNFNDGVPIPEEEMTLILAAFTFLVLLIGFSGWFWLRKRSLKIKAPHELSGRGKEKRLEQLEKERAKEIELQIKQEEKMREEKKGFLD